MTLHDLFLLSATVAIVSLCFTMLMQALTVQFLRSRCEATRLPGISILKPLKGHDPELYENLVSFALQDYPNFELILGAEQDSDPALADARRLQQAFPKLRITVVAGAQPFGLNPKVNNLRQLEAVARYDHILISDADVRVGRDYLKALAAELSQPNVGLVSNIIAGTGARSAGATLDNLHLNTFVANAVCGAQVLAQHPVVVGKSMCFKRSDFQRLGGWALIKDVLAEDYVLGQRFHAAGKAVRLCSYVVRSVNDKRSVSAFLGRHLRWGQMRRRLAPALYWGEPLLLPSAWLHLSCGLALLTNRAFVMPLLALLLCKVIADAWSIFRLTGRGIGIAGFLLLPLKDLMILAVWALAAVKVTVSWRGNSFRVGPGSVLSPIASNAGAALPLRSLT